MSRLVVLVALGVAFVGASTTHAQGIIAGRVTADGRALAGVGVQLRDLKTGASTDSTGSFRILGVPRGRHTVVARLIGFAPSDHTIDVLDDSTVTLNIALASTASALNAIVTTGTLQERFVSESPVKVDVITQRFLQRNVTNNLMDNLPFVSGLAQQVDCGVCFTNNIRINGMEGPYTAVLVDGTPVMSSLATVYGLNGLNPSLIEQVEVIKGPASTLYGTEAMGGVINIITKDPRFAPRYTLNAFGTSHGETSLDFGVAPRIGKVYTLLSGSIAYNDRFIDGNGDNFSDLPLNRRVSLFNKWSIGPVERRVFDLSAKYYYEDRFGGVSEWRRADRGSNTIYGESIITRRGELIGSVRLPFESESVRLWFSANAHDQNSYYGSQSYNATQQVAFGQLLWDKQFGTRHSALFGGTLRYQTYNDNTPATAEDQRRTIPGVFAQDEITLASNLTLLGGIRIDQHREHGTITSPRLNVKWQPRNDDNTTVRLNAATGFRVVNLFTEDHAAITGARRVIINETLRPERSSNVTLNLNQHLHFKNSPEAIVFDLDGFHTRFSNKIQPDYNRDPNTIVYGNLNGYAITRGVSLAAQLDAPSRPYSFSTSVTLQDVYVNADGVRRALEFAPDAQATLSAGYAIRAIGVGLDYTARAVGPMQLPEFPGRATRSPWFSEHHLQLTKAMPRSGAELYVAVKNLFDYQQRDPLVNPAQPFSESFDTYYVYGPLQGRRYLAGMRFSASR